MKALALLSVASLLALGTLSVSADPLLHNGDLSGGLSGWHGDARLVYLNPDGTEADDASGGAIPVLKLKLSNEGRMVYQEYETHDSPGILNISVDVMPSKDLKRSADAHNYAVSWSGDGTWYWSALVMPPADFWIRGGPGWYYKMATNLKQGTWTTLKGHFEGINASTQHSVYFCVPPGEGAVYIKNAVVSP